MFCTRFVCRLTKKLNQLCKLTRSNDLFFFIINFIFLYNVSVHILWQDEMASESKWELIRATVRNQRGPW